MPFSLSLVWQFILQNQFSRDLPQGVFCTRPTLWATPDPSGPVCTPGPVLFALVLAQSSRSDNSLHFHNRKEPGAITDPTTEDFLRMQPSERERLSVCVQSRLDLQRLWLLHQPDDIARKCGPLMPSGHILAHESPRRDGTSHRGASCVPPRAVAMPATQHGAGALLLCLCPRCGVAGPAPPEPAPGTLLSRDPG